MGASAEDGGPPSRQPRQPTGADDHIALAHGAPGAQSAARIVNSPRLHISAWLTYPDASGPLPRNVPHRTPMTSAATAQAAATISGRGWTMPEGRYLIR